MRAVREPILQDDGTALIPLGGKRGEGLFAIVDQGSLDVVGGRNWSLHSAGYAATDHKNDSGLMHRVLLPEAVEVDHRNRNRLDNRMTNLRPATRSQNQANRHSGTPAKSGYRGVRLKAKRYDARIEGRHLGRFDTPIEAARAYDTAARETHGEFAILNFPDQEQAA